MDRTTPSVQFPTEGHVWHVMLVVLKALPLLPPPAREYWSTPQGVHTNCREDRRTLFASGLSDVHHPDLFAVAPTVEPVAVVWGGPYKPPRLSLKLKPIGHVSEVPCSNTMLPAGPVLAST